jgi:dTDP-4-amino-4,6-dideoxygalactose transaminase
VIPSLRVPMADPAAQWASLGSQVEEKVLGVLRSGAYILGQEVTGFEEAVASYCGVGAGIGVGNGTDALLIALMALGVGPGDEVITPAFTFVATVETVALLGATPVFVDIDPVSYTMDPQWVSAKVTERTRVILPVHLFGQAANLEALRSIADSLGITVLADGAQSIGAQRFNRPVASLVPLTTLSFYPTKNLGAAGDGGMVLSNDPNLTERLRRIRFHGSSGTYDYQEVGVCSRLDAVQAALLSAKLEALPEWTRRRQAHAAVYVRELSGIDGLVLPEVLEGNEHTFHQFTLRVQHGRRDALRQWLLEHGVASGVFYPVPLHLAPAYQRRFGGQPGDHPESELACEEVLSIPVHAELTEMQRSHVVASIRAFFEKV